MISINNDSRYYCSTTCYPVQKVKYLGFTIDANLKWKNHIINTIGKIKLLFYKFKTNSNILSPATTRPNYTSYDYKYYNIIKHKYITN